MVDVITGGSPCQDLSVAGKRAGMKHEANGDDETTRSGLFMDQIRLVKEMRENDRRSGRTGESVRPRYMVWENVPGAFSSNHGKDFQAVLEEIIKVAEPAAPGVPLPEEGRWSKAGCLYDELGKWSLAWRVHDAQFHGVAQRRKRISLLADFGGLTAPWIMFDPQLERETEEGHPYEAESDPGAESRSQVQPVGESLPGYSEPSGEAGQETAGGSGEGSEGAGRAGCLNPWDIQSKRVIDPNGVADALYSGERRYGGGEAYVMDKTDTICLEGNGSRESHFGNGYSESDVMYTLNTIEQHGVLPVAASGVVAKGNGDAFLMDEKSTSLSTGGGMVDSVASNSMKSSNPISGCREVDVAKTLDCFAPNPSKNQGGIAIVQPQYEFSAGFDSNMGAKAGNIGYEEEKSPTLNAGKIMSVVASAGFSYGQSADARSIGYQDEVSPTLRGGEGGNQKPCVLDMREAVPIENHPNDSRAKICEDGVVQTLSGRMGTGGNNTPLVMERVIPFDTTQITSPNNWSHPKPDDPCHPLASTAHPPAVAYGLDQQGGKGGANYSEEVCPPILSDSHGTPHAIAFTQNQREEVRDLEDVATAVQAESGMHQQTYVATCIGNGQGDIASHISEEKAQTLNCMHDQLAVMTAVDCRNGTENEEVNGTLQAKEQGQNLNSNNVARTGNTVRRLTPLECERLQSFPDNWTNIGDWVDSKGKLHKGDADTPRYKALGNSIALPFWDWLLGRISAQYDRPATLGSLFDGISGFPLLWEKHNGRGTAKWTSEIEEFPIAVCKKHFGDEDAGIEGDIDEYL